MAPRKPPIRSKPGFPPGYTLWASLVLLVAGAIVATAGTSAAIPFVVAAVMMLILGNHPDSYPTPATQSLLAVHIGIMAYALGTVATAKIALPPRIFIALNLELAAAALFMRLLTKYPGSIVTGPLILIEMVAVVVNTNTLRLLPEEFHAGVVSVMAIRIATIVFAGLEGILCDRQHARNRVAYRQRAAREGAEQLTELQQQLEDVHVAPADAVTDSTWRERTLAAQNNARTVALTQRIWAPVVIAGFTCVAVVMTVLASQHLDETPRYQLPSLENIPPPRVALAKLKSRRRELQIQRDKLLPHFATARDAVIATYSHDETLQAAAWKHLAMAEIGELERPFLIDTVARAPLDQRGLMLLRRWGRSADAEFIAPLVRPQRDTASQWRQLLQTWSQSANQSPPTAEREAK